MPITIEDTATLHAVYAALNSYTFTILGQESAGVGPDTHDSETVEEVKEAAKTQLLIRGETL